MFQPTVIVHRETSHAAGSWNNCSQGRRGRRLTSQRAVVTISIASQRFRCHSVKKATAAAGAARKSKAIPPNQIRSCTSPSRCGGAAECMSVHLVSGGTPLPCSGDRGGRRSDTSEACVGRPALASNRPHLSHMTGSSDFRVENGVSQVNSGDRWLDQRNCRCGECGYFRPAS